MPFAFFSKVLPQHLIGIPQPWVLKKTLVMTSYFLHESVQAGRLGDDPMVMHWAYKGSLRLIHARGMCATLSGTLGSDTGK